MPTQELANKFGLGIMDQISFAVRDLDKALPAYEAIYGPFKVGTRVVDNIEYLGRKVGPTTLKLGFAYTNGFEIELVQVVEGEFPQADWLKTHDEGFQHIRFRVEDFDGARERMEAAGFERVLLGKSPTAQFCYLKAPPELNGLSIELIYRDTW